MGNSSSGIREAHMFNTPVVNIGTRQTNRERTSNIVDVGHCKEDIKIGINKALKLKKDIEENNIYGDGTAGKKMAKILAQINIEDLIHKKLFF